MTNERGRKKGNIFISYRREDSAGNAGRISDQLAALFGRDRIFIDVDDIAAGQPFPEAIDQTLATCEVALVVIGPRWMEILRKRSQEQQVDYVAHEVASALAAGIRVIPVLVGGASMAQLAGLPDKLAPLSLRNAAELRDSTFTEDCSRLAKSLGPPTDKNWRRRKLLAIGSALGLVALLFAWFGPIAESRKQKARVDRIVATAGTQVERGEYESAFRTYKDALKIDSDNRAVMDLHEDAAMGWLRNFRVVAASGQKSEDLAAPLLAEIKVVLDGGLTRTNRQGPRAADILAHLGWMHWLNQRIAYREFGPAAERDLREAIRINPSNVFANAMLGNWLLQTRDSLKEALQHFDVALKTNQHRPFIRQLQLGGMIYNSDAGVRSELIRVANQMRVNGEPIDAGAKRRILTAYDPIVNSYTQLTETLSAVTPAEAWATYLWLDDKQAEGRDLELQRSRHQFIRASILEIEGKASEALPTFEALQRELQQRQFTGRMADHVAAAIKRLSR